MEGSTKEDEQLPVWKYDDDQTSELELKLEVRETPTTIPDKRGNIVNSI